MGICIYVFKVLNISSSLKFINLTLRIFGFLRTYDFILHHITYILTYSNETFYRIHVSNEMSKYRHIPDIHSLDLSQV